MKLRYNLPKGRRVKKNGRGLWRNPETGEILSGSYFFAVTTLNPYWWQNGRWVHEATGERSSHTEHGYVNSVRAFRRRLKQWSLYLPKGVQFILCSRSDSLCVKGST